jgi:hypothetical protein
LNMLSPNRKWSHLLFNWSYFHLGCLNAVIICYGKSYQSPFIDQIPSYKFTKHPIPNLIKERRTLVQATRYTCIEISQWNPLTLLNVW